MTPPPIIWYDEATDTAAPYRTVQPPGAVPYMLARPMPIETAPKGDGRYNAPKILAFWPVYGGRWEISQWDDDRFGKRPRPFWTWGYEDLRAQRMFQPTHWLPLPPAPEEA